MNVERCIELHNEILRHGWVNSGHDPSQFGSAARPWVSYFNDFGDAGQAILPDLVPELGQFLQQARIVEYEPDRSGGYSFFFWVDNLARPGNMFEYEEMWEMILDKPYKPMKCKYEAKRFIVLYTLNQLASHHVGLVYDQKSQLCILCPDLDDMDGILLQRTKWYPLDVVLDYWLSTVRSGRIVAVPKHHPNSPFEGWCGMHPWRFMRFYDNMLDETLDAFNRLVEAIETRLPQGSSLSDDLIEYGLVDADVLQLHEIAPGFAREFLECARTPRFKYIAPGLEVITTSNFSRQPFIPDPDDKARKDDVPAILIFYSKLNYNNSQDLMEPGGTGPFGYDHRHFTSFPAGLYLIQTRWSMSDDACKFILPFSIGGNGYARRTDGLVYGWGYTRGSFDDLYSLGSHPFETHNEQNLASVLRNWLGMVERGDWKIDENGVAGGMEIWKEADTEEHWEKYVIKPDFV
ncbi:Nn.00g053700.m01.CDS01 [Neocucurbitaria sp. VM-36]